MFDEQKGGGEEFHGVQSKTVELESAWRKEERDLSRTIEAVEQEFDAQRAAKQQQQNIASNSSPGTSKILKPHCKRLSDDLLLVGRPPLRLFSSREEGSIQSASLTSRLTDENRSRSIQSMRTRSNSVGGGQTRSQWLNRLTEQEVEEMLRLQPKLSVHSKRLDLAAERERMRQWNEEQEKRRRVNFITFSQSQ